MSGKPIPEVPVSTDLHITPQPQWPNIYYEPGYKLDKNNAELNPLVLTSLMIDMGVPPDMTNRVAAIVNKRQAGGLFKSKTLGLTGVTKDGIPAISINYEPRQAAKTTIHETQHLADSINHGLISSAEAKARRTIGTIMGLGISAVTNMTALDLPEKLTHPSPYAKALGLMTAFLTTLGSGILGRHIGLITNPDERRAFKAERNPDLLNKYEHTLFIKPKRK